MSSHYMNNRTDREIATYQNTQILHSDMGQSFRVYTIANPTIFWPNPSLLVAPMSLHVVTAADRAICHARSLPRTPLPRREHNVATCTERSMWQKWHGVRVFPVPVANKDVRAYSLICNKKGTSSLILFVWINMVYVHLAEFFFGKITNPMWRPIETILY